MDPRSTTVRCLCLLALTALLQLSLSPASGADDPASEWPLAPAPEVVNHFAPPADRFGAGHRGVDLAGRFGQPVLAARPGTVAFAGKIAGKPVVTIKHDDTTRTTYEPVHSDLAVGATVGVGEQIGTLQLVFSHCFPSACLHWGWLRGKTYLDPLDLVEPASVRLLPLWRDEPVVRGSSASWRPPSLPYAAWSPWRRLAQARGWAWR